MDSSQDLQISDEDMPALFYYADKASTDAQRGFISCVFADLSLLVVGSVLGALSVENYYKVYLAVASAVLMTGGLILTIYIATRRYEKTWYDGRAVAESVKTRAWRFLTCSDPYTKSLSDRDLDEAFIQTLREVMKEREELVATLSEDDVSKNQITQKMRNTRSLPLEQRIKIYLDQRINNQRVWYSKKSKLNREDSHKWFAGIVAAQFLGIVFAIILITHPDFAVNLSSVFAGMASAFIAWIQIKRYRELANSYALTAQELGLIAEKAKHIKGEGEFSQFVLDSENAISREHTLWVARRDRE